MRAGIAAMLRARTRGSRRSRRALGVGAAAAGLALLSAACGPVSASTSDVGTSPTSGGVATFATTPGFPANYVFPMDSITYFDVTNTNDFQYLMYRPLYWFGKGSEPYLNLGLSLAEKPVYSGQTVTIKLKNYKWSNGEPVTAQNVIFWINMMRAEDPLGGWGGYVSGDFPDDVTNVRADGSSTVVMTIKGAYSQLWFTDNELSQITPMPLQWDMTSATANGHCMQTVSACVAVYNYLNAQSSPSLMNSWASSPLWKIVDGPWKLIGASDSDTPILGINSAYSGALPAHHISEFKLLPFTSEQAEFNVLQDPQNGERIDYGYLPTVDAPVPSPGKISGGNPVSLGGYDLTVLYPWQITYFPYNYANPQTGPIFKQLYFREAFQSLVDQEGIINGPLHGYGKPTIGPVGDTPVTQYLSKQIEQDGDRWPLSPTHAANLLSSNGWKIDTSPGGVDTCVHPGTAKGECGANIRAGAQLSFTLDYALGVDWMYSGVKELVSNASLVGIRLQAIGENASTVIGTAFCPSTTPSCPSWDLAQWGAWSYAPDYLPTGEELFEKNSSSDAGLFNDTENNRLIDKTLTASPSDFLKAMWAWENYLSPDLPVVYEPNVPTLVESVASLHIGVQAPTLNINPEDWYYLK
jgi:peptide/nickel transport system substrate-binding protein